MMTPDPIRLSADPDRTILPPPGGGRGRWRLALPALVAMVLLAGLIAIAVFSLRQKPEGATDGTVPAASTLSAARIDAPFAPDTLRPLSREQAEAWNGKAPAAGAIEAATGFAVRSGQATDYQRSLQCLTMAIYYEAGNEPDDGERAVAQVILNRVRHPAYPRTVCGVVFDGAQRRTGCQFTFACDGALARVPSQTGWRRANRIAVAALAGDVFAPVGWATHYHANYVVPYWASSLDKVAAIGAHIFYRSKGVAGLRGAFRGVYAGNEPLPAVPTTAVPTPTAEASAVSAAPATGLVGVADRPVLTRSRADDTAPVVGLGERRVLPRAAPGDPVAPVLSERRVLPVGSD